MKTAVISRKASLRLLAQTSALLALVFTFVPMAQADTLTYHVTVANSNTLDLQFNPGQLPGTQLAFATAALPTCCNLDGWNYTGDVTDDAQASPPSNVFFDNQSALNEAIIQFEVDADTILLFSFSISGPAVDTPNGTSSSGTTFSIGPDNPGLNPNGILGLVNLNLDGTGTIETFSPDITITALNPPPPPPPPVPEPSTLVLLATGLTGTIALVRRKSSRSATPRVTDILS